MGPSLALAVSAGISTGSGGAIGPSFLAVSAGISTGSGGAIGPSLALADSAGISTGSGGAIGPSLALAVSAGISTGSGGAIGPSFLAVSAGISTGSGGAMGPSFVLAVSAGISTGSGGAMGPSLVLAVSAGMSTGSGGAIGPSFRASSVGAGGSTAAVTSAILEASGPSSETCRWAKTTKTNSTQIVTQIAHSCTFFFIRFFPALPTMGPWARRSLSDLIVSPVTPVAS